VLLRWKEHFEPHLNDGAGHDRPPNQVDLGDDGVEIDLPSREKIEGALKYLKNNKAAGSDSISAKLLKKRWTKLGECLERANPACLNQRDSTGKLDQRGTVSSRLERFCTGKFQTQKMIRPYVLKNAYTYQKQLLFYDFSKF
jgi:hypothetical protein